tara:strand:+ start:502 stop:2016 length:1515 start_codon:yes stop_codon:yes gene_type:complete
LQVNRFFAKTLTHVKGQWSGRPFEFIEWQEYVISKLFGTVGDDGLRTYRTCYIEIPRKNGKSTFCAGTALYMLFADKEPGAEIYSAAADREQASIVFDVARQMVEASPVLSKLAKIYRKSIVVPSTGSVYKAISSEAGTKHGFNAHAIIFDELHVQPNRELWDTLRTSVGAREQPLTIAITTAGYDRNSICWEVHDYAIKVRDGIVTDPSFLPVIYCAEIEDDWKDRSVWEKANPSLGKTLNVAYLETECAQAIESPAKENTFRRLHLNQWTEQKVRWLSMEAWEKCGNTKVDRSELEGKPCVAGLDLASTRDLTSLCLLFKKDEGYDALWWFWIPRDNAVSRERMDSVPYLTWHRQGFIELTDGNETDYRHVRQRIKEIADEFSIMEIAVDRLFQGAQLSQDLQDDGLNVITFGQGFFSMAAPTAEFDRLVGRGEFHHGGNPVMRWQASNVTVKMDPAGNLKPDKGASSEKIDGIVAAIMALGRIIVTEDTSSVYSERGILTV